MVTFIGIECLTANAIIELIRRDNTREVSFETLVHYGEKVVQKLEKQPGERALLLLSENYQRDMLNNYGDFFEARSPNTFRLRDGVSMIDLEDNFRWVMPVRLYEAVTSSAALRELGVCA